MGALVDLTGEKFGRLTVVKRAGTRNGHPLWQCKCDCGNETFVVSGSLRNKLTKSCGCFDKERRIIHGGSHKDRLYQVWLGMRQRCRYKKHRDFHSYGGRGIKVCDQWIHDYASFKNWAMSNGYDPNAPYGVCTLDRIDVDGPYEPENCRWVTAEKQASNRRNTRQVM